MCRFYNCLFACFCSHDLKIIKPCACSQERYTRSLCDIYQPAKEPIVLRDLCAICTFLGRANNEAPERVYERYYELQDLEELDTLMLQVGGGEDDEMAVVLKADAFLTMMRLVEALPVVKDEAREVEEHSSFRADDELEEDKENMAPVGFSMTLVDRTRKKGLS